MKRIVVFVLLFLQFTGWHLFSQDSSGVFLKFEDYQKGTLAFPVSRNESHAIRLNSALGHFTLHYRGQKIKLNKDSVFAVLDCGDLIRFQNRELFHLSEKGTIWIFYREERIRDEKSSVLVRNYFFCKTGNDHLYPLTVSAIKQCFPVNENLYDALDAAFRTDNAAFYDPYLKTFKINHILKTLNLTTK